MPHDMPHSSFKSPNNRPGSVVEESREDTYKRMIAELEKEKHYYMQKYVEAQSKLSVYEEKKYHFLEY